MHRTAAVFLALAAGMAPAGRCPAANPPLDALTGLINAERARQGLAPFAPHPELEKLASAWARHLAEKGRSFHRSDLGRLMKINGWLGLNENLHMTTLPFDAADVVAVWLKSPPHRRNLLDPEATHLGIGTTVDPLGRTFTVFNAAHIPPPGPPAAPQPAMAGLIAPPGAAKPSPFSRR